MTQRSPRRLINNAGKYFVKCTAVPSSKASYDEETASRPWQASAEMTGLTEAVA